MSNSYIIAIDFGTAFSGHAFSLTASDETVSPRVKRWGHELGLDTAKTLSCILFDEHEKFLKFGYEAKTAYTNMSGEEAKDHLFFKDFKMSLYNTKVSRDLMITAANGKEMKALKVFTAALRYMKEDALNTIHENTSGIEFIASDFTWVLTVPAIWDPSAKQFMREAAAQAEIVTKGREDQLVIALEPEAASVWCKKLPAEGFITQNQGEKALDQSPGTQYIVVDCGGGTIDITVHEVVDGGKLKELHKASGNDLGGQTVDRKFKQFLREIFSDGVWDEYEAMFPSEVQKLMYDFTVLKQVDEGIQISCPFNLGTLAQSRQAVEMFFESVEGASWNNGSIKISREKMKSFFDESLRGITDSLSEIMTKHLNIGHILLVGGYANSKILRRHINDQFGSRCKVLCPLNAQEAIMTGAVMFGRDPAVVASRKSAFTYGIAVSEQFDESRHKEEKKYSNIQGVWCEDIFMKLVEAGEDVGWDEIREHLLTPVKADQLWMRIRFYRTEKQTPVYVNDSGVKAVGSFHVLMPDTSGGLNRTVRLEIKFGSTEITAKGTDNSSGSKGSVRLEFMTKGEDI